MFPLKRIDVLFSVFVVENYGFITKNAPEIGGIQVFNPFRLSKFGPSRQNFFCMVLGVWLSNDFDNFTRLVNEESGSGSTHIGTAHEFFLTPEIVLVYNFLVFIRH